MLILDDLEQVRLKQNAVDRLADVTLLSDGQTIYAAHSPDEVVDVFRRGQGVFGIAVGPVQEEVAGALVELPTSEGNVGLPPEMAAEAT